MPTKDPFIQVYESIWATLEGNDDFAALVPSKYRVKYFSESGAISRFPERDVRPASEHAQVVVEPGAPKLVNAGGTSSHTPIEWDFRIWVVLDDGRIAFEQGGMYQGVYPITWAIIRAMMDWETHMKTLVWNGNEGYVHHVGLPRAEGGRDWARHGDQEMPAKAKGWKLAWQGVVEMWFPSEGDTGLLVT